MWRQLSGFNKFRFVCFVIGLPAAVVAGILCAMAGQWVKAAIQAFLVFSFSYYLYKLASRGRGKSSNPTVVIGIILAVIVLTVGGFFGYQHFVKHGSPATTINASDNSFTVTVPPNWGTANVPRSTAYVLVMNHPAGSRESMVVQVDAPNSTPQEAGKSAMDNAVNQMKAVIDADGGLQPTTVDGEAALRWSFTLPISAKGVVVHHIQEYFVLHRNIEYTIVFGGDPDEYVSNHADFDAIMHSWKWSTSQLSTTVAPADVAPTGPLAQPAYGPQVTLPFTFTGHDGPRGVAVDSAGNLYVTDGNKRVLKLAPGSSTPTTMPFTGLTDPEGVAVDGAGNVFVSECNGRVLELAAGSSTQTVLPFTDLSPCFVAVDSADSVYVTNYVTNGNRAFKLAAGSSTQTVLPFPPISGNVYQESGVTVDSTGNVYVTNGSGVLMLAAGSSTPVQLPLTGLQQPRGVAVDSAGNVYATDAQYGDSRVLKLPAGSSTPTVLPFTGINQPWGMAVDSTGNVYVADYRNNRVVKLPVR